MKQLLLLALMLPFLCEAQLTMRANTTLSDKVHGNRLKGYYEFLPEGYNKDKKYPTIFFFHGLGETGQGTVADLPKLLKNGLPKELKNGTVKMDFIVIIPQTIAWTQDYDVEDCINNSLRLYPAIDSTRMFIAGLSMGGGAEWAYLANKPTAARLAGAIIVCGAAGATDAGAKNIAAKKVPLLLFHNDKDPQVQVATTNGWYDKLTKLGANVKKTIYASTSHDAWSKAFSPSSEVYAWLQTYAKASTTPPITTGPVVTTPVVTPPVVTPPVVNPPVVTPPVAKKLLVEIKVYADGSIEYSKPSNQ